jgi:hypothetical protein
MSRMPLSDPNFRENLQYTYVLVVTGIVMITYITLGIPIHVVRTRKLEFICSIPYPLRR